MKILDQRGQGLTEYLILLMLVSVVSIGAVHALGGIVKEKIESARNEINNKVTFRGGANGGQEGGGGGLPKLPF